jgi:hypothetical protein
LLLSSLCVLITRKQVNQAVGRVIRHQQDWGAIILCDERFATNAQRGRLSKWLRPRWQIAEKYGAMHGDVVRFIKGATQLFGEDLGLFYFVASYDLILHI